MRFSSWMDCMAVAFLRGTCTSQVQSAKCKVQSAKCRVPYLVHGTELLHPHWGNRAYILFLEALIVLCSDDSELQATATLLACHKVS